MMNCEIIRDLLPLSVDDCCSAESAAAVREHLANCPACRELYASMRADVQTVDLQPGPARPARVSERRASVLQSALLFVFFGIITLGVAREAATPDGPANAFWAFALIVPATGFLLSLANWYFVRLYESRKQFSICSALLTALLSAGAFAWAFVHYQIGSAAFAALREMLAQGGLFRAVGETTGPAGILCGIVLTIALIAASGILSGKFAALLGKE